MRLIRLTTFLSLVAIAASTVNAAFIVEPRNNGAIMGKAFATNFGFGGDTTATSPSSTSSAARGLTAGLGNVFGGNGSLVDTFVYRYTPGTDADNTTYVPGTILGSTTGFPGQGNVATGLAGGATGFYNVYFTTPSSTNVSANGSDFTITQNGAPISLLSVVLNNGGTGADTDPGAAFVGGANNAWFLLGTVQLNAGTTYTITQESNDNISVSQRSAGVMWEFARAIPEPSTIGLAGLGLMGMALTARRKKS